MADHFFIYSKSGKLSKRAAPLFIWKENVVYEPRLSHLTQSLKIPINEISKIIIGKHADIPKSALMQEPYLLLTIIAMNRHFHFLQQDPLAIHELMRKLNVHLEEEEATECNKRMSMQQQDIFSALLEIENDICPNVEIKILSLAKKDMPVIQQNHFFVYLKTGKLSKQSAPLSVKNERVQFVVPELKMDVPIKKISKIIIGKHDELPIAALKQRCHLLLTIAADVKAQCFLQQNKHDHPIEPFLISLINEAQKIKNFGQIFSLSEEQFSDFEVMKDYDGDDTNMNITIMPQVYHLNDSQSEREDESCGHLVDEDGQIDFADEQMERVSIAIYDVIKEELNESDDNDDESEHVSLYENPEIIEDYLTRDGVERTKSIHDLELQYDELLVQKDGLELLFSEKDLVTIIGEDDTIEQVQIFITKDFVQIGMKRMEYADILGLIYCIDFEKKWVMLTKYGEIQIIASSEEAREKCISCMQSKQFHEPMNLSFY